MSYSPNALGAKLPTGAVKAWPSLPVPACSRQRGQRSAASRSKVLAVRSSTSGSSPAGKRVRVPPRAAYSHSASVGRR